MKSYYNFNDNFDIKEKFSFVQDQISIKENQVPPLKKPSFVVDGKLATGRDFASSIRFGYELANLVNDWKG